MQQIWIAIIAAVGGVVPGVVALWGKRRPLRLLHELKELTQGLPEPSIRRRALEEAMDAHALRYLNVVQEFARRRLLVTGLACLAATQLMILAYMLVREVQDKSPVGGWGVVGLALFSVLLGVASGFISGVLSDIASQPGVLPEEDSDTPNG